MATLVVTPRVGTIGPQATTRNSLNLSDVVPYVQGAGQHMEYFNTTGSPVTVTLTGGSSVSFTPPGYGFPIITSGGKVFTIPANGTVILNLDSMSQWLQGVVTQTCSVGAGALIAHMYV
jgi:hypothetical protein